MKPRDPEKVRSDVLAVLPPSGKRGFDYHQLRDRLPLSAQLIRDAVRELVAEKRAVQEGKSERGKLLFCRAPEVQQCAN